MALPLQGDHGVDRSKHNNGNNDGQCDGFIHFDVESQPGSFDQRGTCFKTSQDTNGKSTWPWRSTGHSFPETGTSCGVDGRQHSGESPTRIGSEVRSCSDLRGWQTRLPPQGDGGLPSNLDLGNVGNCEAARSHLHAAEFLRPAGYAGGPLSAPAFFSPRLTRAESTNRKLPSASAKSTD